MLEHSHAVAEVFDWALFAHSKHEPPRLGPRLTSIASFMSSQWTDVASVISYTMADGQTRWSQNLLWPHTTFHIIPNLTDDRLRTLSLVDGAFVALCNWGTPKCLRVQQGIEWEITRLPHTYQTMHMLLTSSDSKASRYHPLACDLHSSKIITLKSAHSRQWPYNIDQDKINCSKQWPYNISLG